MQREWDKVVNKTRHNRQCFFRFCCLLPTSKSSDDVEGVDDEDVVVVLGQGHDVALRGDLEAAAAGHLDVRAFKLREERARAGKDGHVEAVPVRVRHEHVPRVRQVHAVGEVGDRLAADPAHVLPFLVEHHHAMALPNGITTSASFIFIHLQCSLGTHLEITDEVLLAVDGQVRGLPHAVRDVEPLDEIPVLRDAEHGGRDRVDSHDVAVVVHSQARHNVDVADDDALDKLARPGENLHAGALAPTVAHDDLARLANDRHLPGVPHLALLLARVAEVVLVQAILVKHLGQRGTLRRCN